MSNEPSSRKEAFAKRARLLEKRLAAKTLSDVELNEGVYKADFEIGEKYTSFSTEIIRLSLIGIAAYGFLISEVLFKISEMNKTVFFLPKITFMIAIIGVLALGLSLASALYHRFHNTSCLYDQILISRSLLRLKNDHWTQEQKNQEEEILSIVRHCQKLDAKRYERILFWSGFFLFLGLASVLLIFFSILFKVF